ncbi:hypothetical protein SAMN05660226_01984 [Parapedobacter luteus]|uniref:Uncharacterized protein n=1 Tax=Parapedobacter luteus TaxID=623280 RepID=A0A1T5C9A5_9SPHI|nr:hypothetical protein [Parapedobacter luteus]SKB56014.1 hypothetical protein SAMN05660226_01984 [Parapedobacter luteus]
MDGYRLYRYVDNRSILVIKSDGKLVRVYCPFPVMDERKVILTVEAIAMGNDGFPSYLIDGTYYSYSLFLILV